MLMGMNTEQKKMLNLGTASEYTYLTMVIISALFSIIPLPFASSIKQLQLLGAADGSYQIWTVLPLEYQKQ